MSDLGTQAAVPRWGGLRPTRELSEFLIEVRNWAEEYPLVTGLAVYGSAARGEADPYSDLDLVAVVRTAEDAAVVEREIVLRRERVLDFSKDGKRVVFVKDPFVKVEVTVVSEDRLPEVRRLFLESRIPEPGHAVLFDKSGALTEACRMWSPESVAESEDPFEREAHSFLYYYHGLHAPLSRRDLYRAFFQYSLAFFKLATLSAIADGERDYLYSPKFLLRTLGDKDASCLREVSPVLDPLKMAEGKERMFDLFLELVGRAHRAKSFPPEAMSDFRSRVVSSHPRFYGLRDVGLVQGVRRGVLFRSGRLDHYPGGELRAWIDSVGLRTLVDLRTDREIAEAKIAYPGQVLERVRYERVPVTTTPARPPAPRADPLDPMARLYARLPGEDSFKEALRRVLEILADSARCPVAVHCAGGTDRTGMVVAVVLLALGIDRDAVLSDYLLSYGHTKAEYMEWLVKTVGQEGGLGAYLARAGILPELLDAARSNVLELDERQRIRTEGRA